MKDKFPVLSSRKYPTSIGVKVDWATKNLYKFVKDHGYDAAEIFRKDGRTGLEAAKTFILSNQKSG